ncbi:MAG: peptidoglycan DD-metalloendopeptidase family protein [Saprospiraceae bacterium]|nr:peptidoglycan DD-metalloendopeptidase family protein [Saprospiraceae bacterium]HMW38299.1 peptidoglycan DD-metalloendopeptidase family protein [Saprospiraceae bacterium]HMX89554.1 peptidoglycan DD-metalloendopeptidase family protein [Saprospiraceae bacterium]HNA64437.1 peptidoglycan DD-metalloendopeptidase family protein [Saprospiraceae bacterium]HNB31310.1 peptidoglycan DD-metalloendopeptidase family protein [Saprospiraceae bacterium]
MSKNKLFFFCATILMLAHSVWAQVLPTEEPTYENNALHPCITNEEYDVIDQRIAQNLKRLKIIIPNTPFFKVSLAWPLKPSDSLKDCSYYRISAYVDHNTSSGAFQDYNCGTNTYDAHKGTDISIWPYNFYKMDHNLVEVVAAASGTIVDKHEGEFDKNCASTSMLANYLVIKHEDGSQVLYFHMKKNSLTAKGIGDKILAGEHVGFVGSSGNSSGPHLHFEVWSGSTSATLIDPFAGTCNKLNNTSWWEMQKPYNETTLVKVSTNTTDIVIPACPGTEIPNESRIFKIPFQGSGLPAGFAKFYIFIRNEVNGMTGDMQILNPDRTLFASWTYSSTMDSKTRIQGWSKKLPTADGRYYFRASYNGQICEDSFEIRGPLNSSNIKPFEDLHVRPNPVTDKLCIDLENYQGVWFDMYEITGRKILSTKIMEAHTEIHPALKSGIYFIEFHNESGFHKSEKVLVE